MPELKKMLAVVGCGYWGKNLVRTFHELGTLRWICDVREECRKQLGEKYQVQTDADLGTVLNDPEVEAVAIAVPAADHFKVATRCLLAGKHVFVEKPLALTLE